MDKQDILKLLTALGSSSKEVAETLWKSGIKGYRGACSFCPITNYLEKHGKKGTIIQAGVSNISVRIRTISVADGEQDHHFLIADHPELAAIRDFIIAFDNGRYHFLDWAHTYALRSVR